MGVMRVKRQRRCGPNWESVEESKRRLAQNMGQTLQRHLKEAQAKKQKALGPLEIKRQHMVDAQRKERAYLDHQQKQRWDEETRQRNARFQKGLKGLIDHVTGTHKRIQTQNMLDMDKALKRDRQQKQDMIIAQLKDRQTLQTQIKQVRDNHAQLLLNLRKDQQHYKQMEQTALRDNLKPQFDRSKEIKQKVSPQERIENLRRRSTRPPDRGPDRER